LAKRFLKLPIEICWSLSIKGNVMIDALAIALATVAMGIPAIITAAASAQSWDCIGKMAQRPCRNGLDGGFRDDRCVRDSAIARPCVTMTRTLGSFFSI
jgi:hypothetical protein